MSCSATHLFCGTDVAILGNDSAICCLQGAAFDLPQEEAKLMLEEKEELVKRKFTFDQPQSLPVDTRR